MSRRKVLGIVVLIVGVIVLIVGISIYGNAIATYGNSEWATDQDLLSQYQFDGKLLGGIGILLSITSFVILFVKKNK